MRMSRFKQMNLIYLNRITFLLLLFLLLLGISSCRNNRLKTNEKELRQEILLQEKEKEEAEIYANKNQKGDSLNSFPRAFRYKEDRSVDPQQSTHDYRYCRRP